MKRMLDRIGFDSTLEARDFPKPGSNRGYSPIQLLLQFMLSVWDDANRFEHSEVIRHDPVLQKLFGFKRMTNFKAIMRLFRNDERADAKGKQLSLFANDPVFACYRYSGLVTDMNLPTAKLWHLYRSHADCENRTKELQYDFGADSFNLKDFWATEAALLTVMLAYKMCNIP